MGVDRKRLGTAGTGGHSGTGDSPEQKRIAAGDVRNETRGALRGNWICRLVGLANVVVARLLERVFALLSPCGRRDTKVYPSLCVSGWLACIITSTVSCL